MAISIVLVFSIFSRKDLGEWRMHNHRFTDSSLPVLIERAISFFESTTLLPLPLPERFQGSGVYALYYQGNYAAYSEVRVEGIKEHEMPLYVGKAVPPGWRQGRQGSGAETALYSRVREHVKSLQSTEDLPPEDFLVRVIILDGPMSSLIGILESTLINRYRPVWNSCIDGFGNHDPGSGRYEQARSEWDTLHHGRKWADRLNDNLLSTEEIRDKAKQYLGVKTE